MYPGEGLCDACVNPRFVLFCTALSPACGSHQFPGQRSQWTATVPHYQPRRKVLQRSLSLVEWSLIVLHQTELQSVHLKGLTGLNITRLVQIMLWVLAWTSCLPQRCPVSLVPDSPCLGDAAVTAFWRQKNIFLHWNTYKSVCVFSQNTFWPTENVDCWIIGHLVRKITLIGRSAYVGYTLDDFRPNFHSLTVFLRLQTKAWNLRQTGTCSCEWWSQSEKI